MKKVLALISFIVSFSAILSAQNTSAFSKVWVYPDLPENVIRKNLTETANSKVCNPLPPDDQRVFGNIRGMGFDKNDNLYVWDDGYQSLWKFTPDGRKSWRKKYEKDGKKEGTFSNVGLAFAVSDEGQICLGDKNGKSLSILDSSGNFLRRFKVDMMPASITFGRDGSIYVTGFGFTYNGELVRHYSSSGQFLGAFCKREGDSKAIDWSGNSGRLSTDNEGNIYYSHFFPYRVEKFTKDGVLIKAMEQSRENFIPPQFSNNNNGRTVESPSGLRGLTYIPQGYLAVMVCEDLKNDQWTMDIMDLEGNIKASMKKSEFPIDFRYRTSACDSKGNLYYDLESNPEPVIIKYTVNYKQLLKQ